MFSFKNFVPVTVKNRVRVSSRVRVRVKGLGLGFRDLVRIRNIIGGAAGAHISMTSYAGATVLARRLCLQTSLFILLQRCVLEMCIKCET